MIYLAKELLLKLTHLTLVGQDEDGLQWTGTEKDWELAEPK